MSATFQSLITQTLKTTWLLTTANRRPGYEKIVHRIQGFVAGALFITVTNLIGELLFEHYPRDSKAFAIAWATAIIVALVYAWIVASIDRNEKEPWQMLLVGLLWGSMVSAAIAALLNSIAEVFINVRAYAVSPYTEELSKGAILFLIFTYADDEFDDALDGIIYGAMVGIGFAMAENAAYFFRFEPAQKIGDQMQTFQFLLRGVLQGLAGHATYTAMTGLGLGLSRQAPRPWLKTMLPIVGLTLAILAHALWNSDAVQGFMDHLFGRLNAWDFGHTAGRVALINGPFFISVVIALILSWRREARVIVEYLTEELPPHHPYISPAMMLTFGGRFRARWRILTTRGIMAWWTLRQLQQALIELAFCKWRGKDESVARQSIKLLRERLELEHVDSLNS